MDNVNNGWGSVYTSTDIQDNVLTFLKCDIMIDEKNIDDEDFKLFLEEHENECFSEILINGHFVSKFSNLLLLPGLGHMELNKARLLLKVLWVPMIANISHLLGFRTSKSQASCSRGYWPSLK